LPFKSNYLSSIKKLAGQTIWYGGSSIFARFLSYLLTPYLTYQLTKERYGEMSLVYALVPFLNTIYTYGMETAFFRFLQKEEFKKEVYNTTMVSAFSSTLIFTILLIVFRNPVAEFIRIPEHSDYILICALIIGCDALTALPFAKLRSEDRPRKFAVIRITSILLNIGLVYFFLSVCPGLQAKKPDSIWSVIYDKNFRVGYVLIANLAASFFALICLWKEFVEFKWRFHTDLWKALMIYSLPLTVAGFAGMINETFDRIMLGWWAPAANLAGARGEVGIYSACYKLSILITLFIQAFRMGAEPFFFKQSLEENAPKTYARVMKFFVLIITVMFLVVALYLDIWKIFIQNKNMWEGLKVVPILLFANMFLGIYYNLSIWYKLSHKTTAGAYITLIGAAITLIINYLFIPRFSYMACAWATFLCYGSMMVISYIWGQKKYPIPYAWKKLLAYMVIVALLYFVHHFITGIWKGTFFSLGLATLFTLAYSLFVLRVEKKEFSKLPYIGKWI
jgi:O-antigen/teichoic acid export membrane protein